MKTPKFQINDVVSIIRTQRGWFDGKISGKIIQKFQMPTGRWTYLVLDTDGCKHEIQHERDIRKGN